jgi:hypothetical protein
MASLADPKIDSVFVCGDYNQRLTRWGSKTDNDLIWAIEGVELRAVTVAYRQTRQLHELATRLLIETDGNTITASLPPDVDNEGLDPVLGTSLADSGVLAGWLAERICEIERFGGTNELPSTAVFVNGEDQVKPIADALNVALSPFSIRPAKCAFLTSSTSRGWSLRRYFSSESMSLRKISRIYLTNISMLGQHGPRHILG